MLACIPSALSLPSSAQHHINVGSQQPPPNPQGFFANVLSTSLARTRPIPHKAWHRVVVTRRAPRPTVTGRPPGPHSRHARPCWDPGALALLPAHPYLPLAARPTTGRAHTTTRDAPTWDSGSGTTQAANLELWKSASLRTRDTVGHKRVRID